MTREQAVKLLEGEARRISCIKADRPCECRPCCVRAALRVVVPELTGRPLWTGPSAKAPRSASPSNPTPNKAAIP